MLVRIGDVCEVEVSRSDLYVRIGRTGRWSAFIDWSGRGLTVFGWRPA